MQIPDHHLYRPMLPETDDVDSYASTQVSSIKDPLKAYVIAMEAYGRPFKK